MATAAVAAPMQSVGAQLRVRATTENGPWREWWHPHTDVGRWSSPSPLLLRAVQWKTTSPGVELSEIALSGAGEAWRVKVVLVRLDPSRVTLKLDADVDTDGTVRPWTINATSDARVAAVALNAGQFTDTGPWGWVVHEGREIQAPGRGALAGAVVIRDDGRVQVVEPDSVQVVRTSTPRGMIAEAIQSYPMLIASGGRISPALRSSDARTAAIDVAHRDARLAIGEVRDGRLLIALTRFDGLGARLGSIPLGLTVPEMAAVMGGLGCHRALMLDGGISAQLAVNDTQNERREWTGLRRVPLGLIVTLRRARAR
jgi:exopolysaccharide biosynthesis protein